MTHVAEALGRQGVVQNNVHQQLRNLHSCMVQSHHLTMPHGD